jgi:hypothetical protein
VPFNAAEILTNHVLLSPPGEPEAEAGAQGGGAAAAGRGGAGGHGAAAVARLRLPHDGGRDRRVIASCIKLLMIMLQPLEVLLGVLACALLALASRLWTLFSAFSAFALGCWILLPATSRTEASSTHWPPVYALLLPRA